MCHIVRDMPYYTYVEYATLHICVARHAILDICVMMWLLAWYTHLTAGNTLLQHTATHTHTLQHAATHCNTQTSGDTPLQHTATHTATRCNTRCNTRDLANVAHEPQRMSRDTCVFGNDWSYPADMWSMGCILGESWMSKETYIFGNDCQKETI